LSIENYFSRSLCKSLPHIFFLLVRLASLASSTSTKPGSVAALGVQFDI
jgi:hypothetical protein